MTPTGFRARKGSCSAGHDGALVMNKRTGKVSCGLCVEQPLWMVLFTLPKNSPPHREPSFYHDLRLVAASLSIITTQQTAAPRRYPDSMYTETLIEPSTVRHAVEALVPRWSGHHFWGMSVEYFARLPREDGSWRVLPAPNNVYL